MPAGTPESYLNALLSELDLLYRNYISLLDNFSREIGKKKLQSLQNFLITERDCISRIILREKAYSVFAGLLPVLPESVRLKREELNGTGKKASARSRLLMNEVRSVMNRLKEEQKSLCIPRTKPIKKESVPALIDIRL